MPERCPNCGAEITEESYVCESCHAHVRAIRAEAKAKMLDDAIAGWRKATADKDAEVARLREAVRKAHSDLDKIRGGFRDQCNIFASSARRVLQKALALSGGEGE